MWTIVLYNVAGEIDRRTVRSTSSGEAEYLHPVDLANACADWLLADGDQIRVIAPTA